MNNAPGNFILIIKTKTISNCGFKLKLIEYSLGKSVIANQILHLLKLWSKL